MYRSIVLTALLIVAASGLPSCADKPHMVYEPPIMIEDLVPGVTVPENTYALLTDDRSAGRFACALAIAKFAPRENGDGAYHLEFEATRPSEQAYWVQQFRGVSAVQGLTFLSPLSVRPEGPTLENLCATALRLGAPLLLVYAPNGLGPNSAQVLGVLLDARTGRPLGTMHAASQFLNYEGIEESVEDLPGDRRIVDARYQAQRSFEEHVLACVRNLIHTDGPPPTTQPHEWQKELAERWWVPVRRP